MVSSSGVMKNSSLYLHEIYPSIQGETTFAGLPTVFVRTSACNLRCSWCDTSYAFGRGTPFELQTIIETVKSYGLQYVCITGGEPLLQEACIPLMKQLCDEGFTVSIETGGSLPINTIDKRVSVILDIKCPGSKMSEKNDWDNIAFLKENDEVKFVLLDKADYLWAKGICNKYALYEKNIPLLFSPVHGALNPQELVSWIVTDRLPVRVNIQTHKYIWTPETQGV